MKFSLGGLYSVFISLFLFSGWLQLLWGPTDLLSWENILDFLKQGESAGEEQAWLVFQQLRLPRMLLAALVGAALAVSGALLQSFFKNPLAEPYILGISSGAGFGAVSWSAFVTGWAGITSGSVVSAFAGAVLVVVLVVAVAKREGAVINHQLLLAGIAMGVLFSSVTTGILLTANTDQFRAMITWLMGSVAYRGWDEVWILAPVTIVGVGFAVTLWKELDWLAVDEDAASTSGVDVRRVKIKLLGVAVALTATSVAVCGAVAFVGLMVPHTVRFFSGASHRHLLILSAVGGAVLVMMADVAGRILVKGVELPLSLVTSTVGAIFFLMMLKRKIK